VPDVVNSYDIVPYTSGPYAQAHPNAMATVATLFGMKPPSVSRARVLELGCASGENLIAMAVELPEGEFLGIEQSEEQVAHGRATIEAVGLKNIELRRMSLLDAGPDLGTFDYIICHGVFSWVPPQVQEKILSLCAENLASHGVAFVSYNVNPGWQLKRIVRDAMLFHIDREADPQESISQARQALDFIVEYAWEPRNCYATLLRELREGILKADDSYLFHEFLEDVNQPLYYHQFLEQITPKGLKPVGDAEFSKMACMAPERIKGALGRMSDDPARWEQYLDFLRGRAFRLTLLCHEDVKLLPAPAVEAVYGLQAAVFVPPGSLSPVLFGYTLESFPNARGQTITLDHPVLKAALLILGEQWPRSIPFRGLWSEVTARLSRAALPGSDCGPWERRRLAEFLLQGYGSGWIELHSHMPPFVLEPGERPATTPLARHQAQSGERVTNLRHESIELKRFDRHLLGLLDGLRTHDALVDALDELVTEGKLSIRSRVAEPFDAATHRSIMAESLRQGLARLAGFALLVA
jgi:methyltransferase-like protein/cyclopropane fatty-acyl-phospholipid synthase-like methyltransferase